jgi:hypothetical protein
MTLRLGFVGTGKWARKLAESFRACGAEIRFHTRSPSSIAGEAKGFGSFVGDGDWQWMLDRKDVDAIIAVAPPEVTTQVALAAAEAGRPVLATKPLLQTPDKTTAPFWIDYWRLWARAHSYPRELRYDLCGIGPFRSFPGGLDYGPHVMAALLDKGDVRLLSAKSIAPGEGELFDCEFSVDGERVQSIFGNGGAAGVRNIWGWEETETGLGGQDKAEILAIFCRAFMSSVYEGYDDGRTLHLARDGMALLEQIREMAK